MRASANFCASLALNGLNARWHRLKIVEAVTEMNFALRVTDFGQLSGLLAKLATVPNVLEARRVT